MPNPFLSEEWMADVRAIRERHAGETPEITTVLKINQVVNGVPFTTWLILRTVVISGVSPAWRSRMARTSAIHSSDRKGFGMGGNVVSHARQERSR